MTRLKALLTLHIPSPTFAPRIEVIEDLPIQQGDTSIIVVLPGDIFEVEDSKAQRYITLKLAEAA